jgi:outer membrane lipoprotein-sorting protein
MKVTRYLVVAALLLVASVVGYAQTAEEIVDRHIEVIGGKAKLAAINSMIIKGVFNIPQAGVEMPYTRVSKRPGKFRMDVTSEMGKMIQATDGETAWQVNQFQGVMEPTVMSDEEAIAIKRQASIDGFFLNREEQGIKLEFAGEETVGGQTLQEVKIYYNEEDTPISAFFEKESGILVKMVATFEQAGMEMESVTIMTDYRETDGLLSAHRLEQSVMGQNFVITVDEIQYNVPVEDNQFNIESAK